jgi:hypothetical protein
MKLTGRTAILLIVAVSLCGTAFADAGPGIRITQTTPKLVTAEPGAIITASFLVENNSNDSYTVYDTLELPKGWISVGPTGQIMSFTLGPGQQNMRILAFRVPQKAPSDTYKINYSVYNGSTNEIITGTPFEVSVTGVTKFDVFAEGEPDTVIAGDSYSFELRFVNRGNTMQKVKVNAKSSPVFPVLFDEAEITIAPGETKTQTMRVNTDKALNTRVTNIISITVTGSDGKILADKSVTVAVFPRTMTGIDPYRRIKSTITATGAIEEIGGTGLESEQLKQYFIKFAGNGSLDKDNIKQVEFLFAGPEDLLIDPWKEKSEYRAAYRDNHVKIKGGDWTYALSKLLDQSHYGRGAEVEVFYNKIGAGSYYVESKDASDNWQKTLTGYLEYKFSDKYFIKGNVLSENIENVDINNMLYSIEAGIYPAKAFNLSVEGGLGMSNIYDENYKGYGYSVDVKGQIIYDIIYSFNKVYAQPEFFGYYNDSDTINANINVPITKQLNATALYRKNNNNLNLDPLISGTANDEDFYSAGISWNFLKGFSASVDIQVDDKIDRLNPIDYDYLDKYARIGFRWSGIGDYIALSLTGQIGEHTDRLIGRTYPMRDYGIYLNSTPVKDLSLNCYVTYAKDKYSRDENDANNLGARITLKNLWIFSSYVDLYIANYDTDIKRTNRLTADITASLPKGHQVDLKGYWMTSSTKEDDYSVFLIYKLPWDIPIFRKPEYGMIKGRVYDNEKGGEPPVANAVLLVEDATAVTNSNGEYKFPAISPGQHSIWVDKKSIGFNRVPAEKMPIAVDVKGAGTKKVDIAVTRAGKVALSLRQFDYKEASMATMQDKASASDVIMFGPGNRIVTDARPENLKETEGVKGVTVQLIQGKEIVQQVTDYEGKLIFIDVRPGKWKLMINEGDIPSEYKLEKNKFDIELKPGETLNIDDRVLPRLRKVRMVK